MKHARLLVLGAALGCSFLAHAQNVRTTQESFTLPLTLPVAPRPAPAPVVPVAVTPAHAVTIAPVKEAATGGEWEIQLKDINIAGTFHRWAAKAGYRVRWDAQKHFMVDAPDVLRGGFEDVVASVLESPGISQGAYPLEVCFYPNTPPLARITRKGEQDKECK